MITASLNSGLGLRRDAAKTRRCTAQKEKPLNCFRGFFLSAVAVLLSSGPGLHRNFTEFAAVEIADRLRNFGFAVHYKGAIALNRLIQRLAGQHQKLGVAHRLQLNGRFAVFGEHHD